MNRRQFLGATAGAVYLPMVGGAAGAASPDPVDIRMPFTCLDSNLSVEQATDGWWYISVQRVDAGDLNGGWVVRWRPDAPAEAVRQVTQAAPQPSSVEPLPGPLTTAQGFMARDTAGRMWYFGWVSTAGRTKTLRAVVVA